jgi:hypothetical protein
MAPGVVKKGALVSGDGDAAVGRRRRLDMP